MADVNPFRYRGYYCDRETGWYYLQTRYYDPATRRFINADNYELIPQLAGNIGELNLYSYCNNNPIMYTDSTGQLVFTLIASIIVGAAIGGTIGGVKAYREGARGWDLVGGIAGGAIMGGAMGAVMALGGAAGLASLGAGFSFGLSTGAAFGISLGIGVGAGMLSYGVENGIRSDRQLSWAGLGMAALSGGFQAAATFGIAYAGGRMGAFDKLLLNPMLDGVKTLNSQVTYGLAKSIMATAFPSIGRSMSETAFKMLMVSGTAAGARWLINWLLT